MHFEMLGIVVSRAGIASMIASSTFEVVPQSSDVFGRVLDHVTVADGR